MADLDRFDGMINIEDIVAAGDHQEIDDEEVQTKKTRDSKAPIRTIVLQKYI
jgi:hypothetical protein